MRETCYFKDDDYRLSFLQGNYVSLTNMTQADVDRIIRYHLPRINISVHTMNPDLRVKMLHNKRAGEVLDYLRQFTESGLLVNAQIVLCPDWNDGEELDFTLQKLGELGENIESISVVPVGMTDHREGLETLRGFDKESSRQVLNQLERWQQKFLDTLGTRLVYAGDEFYLMAELPFPDYEAYEDFPQIENGVGLCASLLWEFEQALSDTRKRRPKKKKTMATGKSVYPFMQTLIGNLEGDRIGIYPIENRFFGEKITVTGLITGQDLIAQLQGKELGEELLISSAMLRHDGDMFLDNTTLQEVEKALGIKVRTVRNDGYELLDALLK
jgi:putative radical SAM enzyme (TIGR03279 family)